MEIRCKKTDREPCAIFKFPANWACQHCSPKLDRQTEPPGYGWVQPGNWWPQVQWEASSRMVRSRSEGRVCSAFLPHSPSGKPYLLLWGGQICQGRPLLKTQAREWRVPLTEGTWDMLTPSPMVSDWRQGRNNGYFLKDYGVLDTVPGTFQTPMHGTLPTAFDVGTLYDTSRCLSESVLRGGFNLLSLWWLPVFLTDGNYTWEQLRLFPFAVRVCTCELQALCGWRKCQYIHLTWFAVESEATFLQ